MTQVIVKKSSFGRFSLNGTAHKLIHQFSAIQNEKKGKLQVFNVICVKQTLVYKTNVTCPKLQGKQNNIEFSGLMCGL
jgi:hypothetical protein